MENQGTHCEHCGASLKQYWHKITPGLVSALMKINQAVNIKKKNDIRIDRLPKEIALSHVERCNWQKLRLHGLIARVREYGEVKRGRWLITRKGYEFLQGHQIPERVKSFRNKVIGHSEELTTLSDSLRGTPYFEGINDIKFDYAAPTEQGEVDNDTPIVKSKKKRLKKGQKPCPQCGEALRTKVDTAPGNEVNTLRVSRWLECPECGYKSQL